MSSVLITVEDGKASCEQMEGISQPLVWLDILIVDSLRVKCSVCISWLCKYLRQEGIKVCGHIMSHVVRVPGVKLKQMSSVMSAQIAECLGMNCLNV